MSEPRLARRKRTTIVNFQITFLSWIMELVGGWIIIIARFFVPHNNRTLKVWLWFADHCFNFIIIPCTYTINNDGTKQVIIGKNWSEGIRSVLSLGGNTGANTPPQNHLPDPNGQNHSNSCPPPPAALRRRIQADDLALQDVEEDLSSDDE